MKNSYELSFEVNKEDVNRLIKELFGSKEQQEERQIHFNEAVVKDALSYFNNEWSHDATLPKKMWDILDSIAVSMYIRGFNQAFAYYIKHEDIFNLESNDKS